MPDLTVDTDGLRAVCSGIEGAARAFEEAQGELTRANTILQGWALDNATDADNKIGTFTRQFRKEFELMSTMLTGFGNLLDQAAGAYDEQERVVIGCLSEGE